MEKNMALALKSPSKLLSSWHQAFFSYIILSSLTFNQFIDIDESSTGQIKDVVDKAMTLFDNTTENTLPYSLDLGLKHIEQNRVTNKYGKLLSGMSENIMRVMDLEKFQQDSSQWFIVLHE